MICALYSIVDMFFTVCGVWESPFVRFMSMSSYELHHKDIHSTVRQQYESLSCTVIVSWAYVLPSRGVVQGAGSCMRFFLIESS